MCLHFKIEMYIVSIKIEMDIISIQKQSLGIFYYVLYLFLCYSCILESKLDKFPKSYTDMNLYNLFLSVE